MQRHAQAELNRVAGEALAESVAVSGRDAEGAASPFGSTARGVVEGGLRAEHGHLLPTECALDEILNALRVAERVGRGRRGGALRRGHASGGARTSGQSSPPEPTRTPPDGRHTHVNCK